MAILISGAGLYIPQAYDLNHSPKFLVKMIIVAVLIVNGILLNVFITPRLEEIFKLRRIRKLAFALGATSITSWYSAFVLGAFRSLDVAFIPLLATYAALLFCAVIGSQIMEHLISKKMVY